MKKSLCLIALNLMILNFFALPAVARHDYPGVKYTPVSGSLSVTRMP
ncbi:MAG TPA: hypothetical protein VFD89_04920 [Clostridia bacterium]|nr:hypothetical protein [Clostridia bacterium]